MRRRTQGRQALLVCGGPLRAPFARSLVWLGMACMPAVAQDATVSRPYYLVPTFNATMQLMEARSGTGPSSPMELVTSIGPGLQLSKQSGRLQGTVDYQLQGTIYSRRTEFNRVDNNLNASARAEAIPGWMYVDAGATVGKQSASPLAQQTGSGSLAPNSNQQEVLNVRVSPFLRGEFRDVADYEFRLRGAATEVRGSSVGDSTSVGSSFSLSSPRRGSYFGWAAQASQDRLSYKGGRTTDNFRAIGTLSATPYPDLMLDVRFGQESTNVGSVERRTFDNWGGGLRWTPTPRTVVSFSGDRRYFGDGFQMTLEHRLQRSAIRFTSSKDAVTSSDAGGLGQPLTLFQLYMRQYQSIEPDIGLRAIRVFELLRLTGQNPSTVVGGSFATSAVTLQRRDDLSYSYIAPRSTFTLRANSGTTEIIDNLTSQRGIGFVKQRGLEASVVHKLTPITNATLLGTVQRNSSPGQEDSDLKSVSLSVTTSVNRNLTATMGARVGVYSGASNSNRETALTGSLSMRF